MKSAQWFNVITVIFAATLAVTMGVVCILYATNFDAAPRVRTEWPTVLAVTQVFGALTVLTGAAFFAQRRNWRARGYVQMVSYLSVPAGSWILYKILA